MTEERSIRSYPRGDAQLNQLINIRVICKTENKYSRNYKLAIIICYYSQFILSIIAIEVFHAFVRFGVVINPL